MGIFFLEVLEVLDKFKIQKSKMTDQDRHHSEMVKQLLRHVTHNADFKGDIFRQAISRLQIVILTVQCNLKKYIFSYESEQLLDT